MMTPYQYIETMYSDLFVRKFDYANELFTHACQLIAFGKLNMEMDFTLKVKFCDNSPNLKIEEFVVELKNLPIFTDRSTLKKLILQEIKNANQSSPTYPTMWISNINGVMNYYNNEYFIEGYITGSYFNKNK